MSTKEHGFRTLAVHAGRQADPLTGAHGPQVYATSTFVYGDAERGARLFAGEEPGYVYGRVGNPTVRAFETRLAALEGAEDAVAFASGMGAISALLLTVLQPGDEVLVLGPLYGGTGALLHETMARFGVRTVEAADGPEETSTAEQLAPHLSDRTRLIYTETPTNPTLRIHDLAAVAEAGRAIGAMTVVDNTFATPFVTRPLELGIDAVLHSATKYLGGHGDTLGGALVGPAELVARVRSEGLRHVGAVLGAFEAFLLLRGLATLPLRMAAHQRNAAAVTQALLGHPAVARVHYPGLPGHPKHDVAKRQMRGFGGMVSLELRGGREAAFAFLDRLQLFAQAVSLGDVASLATHPASTTHQLWSEEARQAGGVTQGLVRLSVGVEDEADLLQDLRQALTAVQPASAF